MSFRMHRYEDGRDGLAAFCHVCGEQITEHGYVVWNPDNVDGDWFVVHQERWDPGMRNGSPYTYSMPLDAEILYLANSVGVDIDKARRRVALFERIGGGA